MADLILNLISLKSKCDAAGVGTTATNSTPSLCPTKSAIPGYVTNGASVVQIYNASSYANNQLVPEANVSVSKTITSTAVVYRSVSVGTSSAPDIPASGGSSRASATVTYQQTTRTYYSDGTYTDGTWTNQSATIYGGYVSANSKGTTVSNRTSTGSTSTPSGTVAGATRTGTAVTVYQAANSRSVSSLYTYTYSLAYIPASGGTNAVPEFYVEATYTYTSGSTKTETVTSSATIKYGKNDSRSLPSSLSSSSSACQYTVGANNKTEEVLVGYAFVHATYSGYTSYDSSKVRQSAGSGVTVTGYELKIRTNSITHIPNSGGTNNVVTLDWIRFYTYSSDGTSDYTTLNASQCTFVGYNRSTSTSEPSSGWSTNPSSCQYTVGANTGDAKTVGYAFMKYKYTYGGTTYSAYDYSKITQDGGYVESSPVYKVYVSPVTYNGTTYTTPALSFYNGSANYSTYAGPGHGRVNSTQTVSIYSNWAQSKVTGIYIVENGNHDYVRYVTVRNYQGSTLLNKYYIGGSSNPGFILFPNGQSFNTSDYTSGQKLYVYYYYS